MGGSNDESNLTKLTYREHYLAHYLLFRVLEDSKSAVAWLAMNSLNGEIYKNSRVFESTMIDAYRRRTESEYGKKISASKKGYKVSDKTKELISIRIKEAMKKVPYEVLAQHLGKHWWTTGDQNCLSVEEPGPEWLPGKTLHRKMKAIPA